MNEKDYVAANFQSNLPIPAPYPHRPLNTNSQIPTQIHETNIDDILALQLSDTLINAAYQLSAMRIQLAIQKLCKLETLFIARTMSGFENIVIYANRNTNNLPHKYNHSRSKNQRHVQTIQNDKQPQEEHRLKPSIIINSFIHVLNTQSQLNILTTEQLQHRTFFKVKQIIQQIYHILDKKVQSNICHSFYLLTSTSKLIITPSINHTKAISHLHSLFTIKQTPPHLIRRSIQKNPLKRSSIQLTYSLNKNINQQQSTLSRNQSPRRKFNPTRVSRNGLNLSPKNNNIYKNNKTFQKQSTCSQSSCKQTQNQQKLTQNNHKSSHNITKRHQTRLKTLPQNSYSFQRSFQCQKQKELQKLRKKYYQLVDEFKQFSERILSVIKEE